MNSAYLYFEKEGGGTTNLDKSIYFEDLKLENIDLDRQIWDLFMKKANSLICCADDDFRRFFESRGFAISSNGHGLSAHYFEFHITLVSSHNHEKICLGPNALVLTVNGRDDYQFIVDYTDRSLCNELQYDPRNDGYSDLDVAIDYLKRVVDLRKSVIKHFDSVGFSYYHGENKYETFKDLLESIFETKK
jgi:hypothetical protein